jgi:hypothetical protein
MATPPKQLGTEVKQRLLPSIRQLDCLSDVIIWLLRPG